MLLTFFFDCCHDVRSADLEGHYEPEAWEVVKLRRFGKLAKMQEKITKPISETWKGSKQSLPHWGWKSRWGGPWCLLSIPTGLPVSPSDHFIAPPEILKAIDHPPFIFRSHLSSITTFNPIYSNLYGKIEGTQSTHHMATWQSDGLHLALRGTRLEHHFRQLWVFFLRSTLCQLNNFWVTTWGLPNVVYLVSTWALLWRRIGGHLVTKDGAYLCRLDNIWPYLCFMNLQS